VATLIVSPGAPTKEAPARPPTARLTPPQAPASGSSTKAEQFAQAGLLVILFAAPALMCIHGACANDPDIWWHLRTGEWILNHHAVPHFDPFSRSSAPRPWAAYSWLFEVVVLGLFRRLGLMGLVAYSAAMVLAITVALHYLIRRLQADFSFAVLLTFAASFTMMRLYTPRPWLFTVLFFVLVESRIGLAAPDFCALGEHPYSVRRGVFAAGAGAWRVDAGAPVDGGCDEGAARVVGACAAGKPAGHAVEPIRLAYLPRGI
jgi:hypothetical protein